MESQVDEAESHSSSHTETYQEQVLTLKLQLDDIRKVRMGYRVLHKYTPVKNTTPMSHFHMQFLGAA